VPRVTVIQAITLFHQSNNISYRQQKHCRRFTTREKPLKTNKKTLEKETNESNVQKADCSHHCAGHWQACSDQTQTPYHQHLGLPTKQLNSWMWMAWESQQ